MSALPAGISPAARPAKKAGFGVRSLGLPRQGWLTTAFLVLVAILFFALQTLPRTWFNDDAFITFRYAENLAAGHGITWNPGQAPIEGSTSLGWTLLLAAASRLGAAPLSAAHLLGFLAGILSLVIIGVWAHQRRWPLISTLTALAFLALQNQWMLWSVSAMESVAASSLALLATLRMLHELEMDSASPSAPTRAAGPPALRGIGSGLLFALATVFRPEMPLLHFFGAVGAALVMRQKAQLRVLVVSGLVHMAMLGLLTLWRLAHFGQAFPNPFYVKVGALQWQRGLIWWLEFLQQNHMAIVVLVMLLSLPWAWRRTREASTVALQIAAWSLWIIAIGGGRWEFRWMVPVLPLIAIGLGAALVAIRGVPPRMRTVLVAWSVCIAVLVSQFQALRSPFQPFEAVLSAAQLTQSVHIMGNEAASLSRYLGPDDLVCVGWAGVFPFITGVQHFDPWGLNDQEIARRPFDARRTVFHQRHATWDDVVKRDVLISDAFNHFLFPRPYDGRSMRVVPWVRPGVDIYSVRLPEGHFWIFASPRPRPQIEAWLQARGLAPQTVVPLPAGLPQIGDDSAK